MINEVLLKAAPQMARLVRWGDWLYFYVGQRRIAAFTPELRQCARFPFTEYSVNVLWQRTKARHMAVNADAIYDMGECLGFRAEDIKSIVDSILVKYGWEPSELPAENDADAPEIEISVHGGDAEITRKPIGVRVTVIDQDGIETNGDYEPAVWLTDEEV